jgi:hypothetical protein
MLSPQTGTNHERKLQRKWNGIQKRYKKMKSWDREYSLLGWVKLTRIILA